MTDEMKNLPRPLSNALLYSDPAKIREQAEQKVKDTPLPDLDIMTHEEIQQQFHELRVKQVEAELQNEQMLVRLEEIDDQAALLRIVTENMLDLVALTDMEGNFLFAGHSHAILGYEPAFLIGKNVMDFVHPEDLPDILNEFTEFVASGDPHRVEYRYRCIDGDYIWLETQGKFITDESGIPQKIVFSSRNTTERKQAEEALRESEENYRRLADNSPDVIYRMSLPEGRYEYVSPASTHIFGYPPQTFYDNPLMVRETLHPDHLPYFEKQWENLLKKNLPPSYEYKIIHKDGSVRWVNQRNILVKNENKRPLAIEGILTDITERKLAEQRLQRQTFLFQNLFKNSPDAIAVLDHEDRVLEINRSFETLFGYSHTEAQGQEINDLLAPEPYRSDAQCVSEKVIGDVQVVEKEAIRCTKGGRPVDVSLIGYPLVVDQQKIGAYAIYRDITERKRAEEALRESEEKFRALFENGPIGVAFHKMVYDDSGKAIDYRFLDANSSYLELTGVDPRGKYVTEVFPGIENDPFDWIGTFGRVAKTGEQIRFEQYLHPNKRWYDCVGYQVKPDFFVAAFVEITERKQAEELLNTSQRLSKVGGWGWDVETQTMWWTKETYRIHDFTPGEMEPGSTEHINKSAACYEPEDCPVILAAFQRCVEEGQPYDLELPFTTAKGRRLWVRTTARPERSGGKIIGVIGNIMDITARKLAEEKLRVSEAKFRSIYENTAVGLAQVSLDFKIMSANEAYCNMLGYQEKDLVGTHLKEITHPDVIEENIQKQVNLASGKIDHYRMEKKFIHKNGQTIHAILDANLIRDVSGKAIYFLGSVVDVTELKQAEMDLLSQKKLLEGVLDSIKDVIGVQLPDHTIVQYNRAGYELLGLTKDQVKGKKCYELLGRQVPCDICVTSRSLISRTLEKVEKYVLELDRHFLCTSNPILDDNGNIKLIIEQLTDITEKKKIDEQLTQAQKMESVGRLAGGVAHDFNNMLGVILGHTEMALDDVDPAMPLYDSLQAVQHAAQHSADLTRQLLAFARKQTAAPKVIDINDTVEGMLKMLRRLIGEDIDLFWQPGRNLQPVKIDPAQIDQLLANLCVNARDAIDGVGKVTIETDAKIFDEDYCHDHLGSLPGEYVLLEVSDDGCGMDKETLNQIFEPFFTTKETGEGTGLGLASIYGIVKQNNGYINVYSEPDQGTTFKIYLPVYATKSAGVVEKAHDLPAEHGNETILLVEDESAILKMTTTMLTRLGYTVVAATTPGEAIRLAHEYRGRIDLLMTDVVMPEMNGRELARNLLSHYPDLKRLFMSGYTANVIAHHGVLDQGVHFIQKPFSMKDLGAKLREALEG